jgi:hypothetical protein
MITVEEVSLLRWDFIESEQRKSTSRHAADVELELGSHAIADERRAMELGKARFCEYRPRFQAVLSSVVESFKG